MSMLSLEPATTNDGSCASMATAGSFCLFCENGVTGLPTVTSVPVAGLPALAGTAMAVPAPVSTVNNAAAAAENLGVRICPPLWRTRQGKRLMPRPAALFPTVLTKHEPLDQIGQERRGPSGALEVREGWG